MANDSSIQTADKQEVSSTAEPTMEGPVYNPAVDIFEDANGLTLLADMPGVKADRLSIDLNDNVLTIRGEVQPPEAEKETEVLREFGWGSFYRQFSLADTIDRNKIEAKLNAGVLRLQLPKVEKAKPRKIAVKTG